MREFDSTRPGRFQSQCFISFRAGDILKRDIVTIQCLRGDSGFQGVTKAHSVTLRGVTIMQLWRDDEARESRSEVSQIVSFGAERANSHGLRADAECAEPASQARYSKTGGWINGLLD